MTAIFTSNELKKMYQLLKAFDEGLLVNPSEEWELDFYDEPIVNRDGLTSILKKLERLVPKEKCEEVKKNILRRRYGAFNEQIDEVVYSKLEIAFNKRKTVEIGYFDMKSAEVKTRRIDIYHKTQRHVLAYCHLRKAMRKFRTSRIVSAKLTSKSYNIPDDFDKNRY
jgi:predicted DNA-binding transcriptional regulator YafY